MYTYIMFIYSELVIKILKYLFPNSNYHDYYRFVIERIIKFWSIHDDGILYEEAVSRKLLFAIPLFIYYIFIPI